MSNGVLLSYVYGMVVLIFVVCGCLERRDKMCYYEQIAKAMLELAHERAQESDEFLLKFPEPGLHVDSDSLTRSLDNTFYRRQLRRMLGMPPVTSE